MNNFIHLWQQRQIQDVQKRADTAIIKSYESRDDIYTLQSKIETLALANQALYEILSDHLGITETQVLQRMQEIDQRDGKFNGRMDPMPSTCPQCGKITNTAQKKCVYCGHELRDGHLFQKL